MEEKVIEILKNILEDDNIDASCSQDNCEVWDSLKHLNLVVELESAFNVSFEPEEIVEMISFNEIIKMLNKKMM